MGKERERGRESEHLLKLSFSNFYRDPNGSDIPTIWPLVTNSTFASMQYMQIGNENGRSDDGVLQAKEDYYSTRAEFWKKLRSEYNLDSWFDEDISFT